MFLVCEVYGGAINIGSMRVFDNPGAVAAYFSDSSSTGAKANDISKWGVRVYHFETPGQPAKRVTKDFAHLL